MSPLLRALISGGLAALLVAGLAFGLTRNPSELPAVSVGRAMPDFTLDDLSGEQFSSQQLRGRPVVVNSGRPGAPSAVKNTLS